MPIVHIAKERKSGNGEAEQASTDIRDDALEDLAERLYFLLEKYDPTPEAPIWEALPQQNRELYKITVQALFEERGAVWTYLGLSPTTA